MKQYRFHSAAVRRHHGDDFCVEITLENRSTKTHYLHTRHFRLATAFDGMRVVLAAFALIGGNVKGWTIA